MRYFIWFGLKQLENKTKKILDFHHQVLAPTEILIGVDFSFW